MGKFEAYIQSLPKTALVESVKALYENIDTVFDRYEEFSDEQRKSMNAILTDYATKLKPFDKNLLLENCVNDLRAVESTETFTTTQPVRFVHYTRSPASLINILKYGLSPRICVETNTNSVWMVALNEATKQEYDQHCCVAFDIPAGDRRLHIENKDTATYWEVIPTEWFVSINFPIGAMGMNPIYTSNFGWIAGNQLYRKYWTQERFDKMLAGEPKDSHIRKYLDDDSLRKLLKFYIGVTV